MLRRLVHVLLLVGLVGSLSACRPSMSPELRVLGIHEAEHAGVVFVQVTNPASRPMRLTKLEYTFAAGKETLATGELMLSRDVPAGAAVVVEVPIDNAPDTIVTLRGRLTAELDQIVQIFKVQAELQPHPAS